MRYALVVLTLSLVFMACGSKESGSAPKAGGSTAAARPGGGAPVVPPATASGAGSTPQATFDAFKKATFAKDGGAFYDLLSPDMKKSMDDQLKQMQDMLAGLPAEGKEQMMASMKENLGFDPADLKTMTGRDFVVKMSQKADEKSLKEAQNARFESEKIDGDKAVVTYKSGEKTETFDMVKIDGKWYLASLK